MQRPRKSHALRYGNGSSATKGVLDDGRKVDAALVRTLIPEELAKVKAAVVAQNEPVATYEQAAKIFEQMSLTKEFPEFLTLPLYEAMD